MKLNQVIALVAGKKAKATKLLTEVHRGWALERLIGIERNYQPLNDDGEKLPDESKKVQLRVRDELKRIQRGLADFYMLVASQEIANCMAKASVTIGKETILENVPVGVLLFLEKQLTDLRTLAEHIPVLDIDKSWHHDQNAGLYVTTPVETIRTQKRQEPLVLYPATDHHPAQTQIITRDVPVGKWSTTYLSGCMAADQKERMIERIDALLDAVKSAREEANSADISQTEAKTIATVILQRVFDK